jgi:hypothetical protein
LKEGGGKESPGIHSTFARFLLPFYTLKQLNKIEKSVRLCRQKKEQLNVRKQVCYHCNFLYQIGSSLAGKTNKTAVEKNHMFSSYAQLQFSF